MLVLLAESKTMAPLQENITDAEYSAATPVFESEADRIMANIEALNPPKLAQILGISTQLAVKAHNLAYDFPHKSTGYKAIFGFTGEAFRSLKASSFDKATLETADRNLRFISSIYGWLKPSDIIKPYRCEFNKPVAPDDKTPIQVFKAKNTVALVNLIKENKIKDIINLLPGDAEKCIDWKICRAFAKVHKIVFRQITSEGKLKTPIASRLKELRGLMAREILSRNIENFDNLTRYESSQFIFSPADSKPLLPVFIAE